MTDVGQVCTVAHASTDFIRTYSHTTCQLGQRVPPTR
jgi:hypothetical protein